LSGTSLPAQEGRVMIVMTVRGADGRLRDVEALPPVGVTEDMVPTWDYLTQSIVWRSPAELGFSGAPMLVDVPVVDGTGAILVDGDGNTITANVPSI
jgi:hypothetical protein